MEEAERFPSLICDILVVFVHWHETKHCHGSKPPLRTTFYIFCSYSSWKSLQSFKFQFWPLSLLFPFLFLAQVNETFCMPKNFCHVFPGVQIWFFLFWVLMMVSLSGITPLNVALFCAFCMKPKFHLPLLSVPDILHHLYHCESRFQGLLPSIFPYLRQNGVDFCPPVNT